MYDEPQKKKRLALLGVPSFARPALLGSWRARAWTTNLQKKKDYLYLGLLGFTCWFTWQLARKSMSTNFKASKASKALVKLVTRFPWQLARKSMSTNFKDKVFKELFEQVLRLLALLVQKY